MNRWAESHLEIAKALVAEIFEPFTKFLVGTAFGHGGCRLGVLDDVLFDKYRAIQAESKRESIAGAGVHGHHLAVALHPDEGVKGIVFEIGNDDLVNGDV